MKEKTMETALSLPPILTVSDLSYCLKKTVEDTYSYIRVRGEVSGLKKHSSGHCYLALKDSEAVMDAVAWRGTLSSSAAQLEEGLDIIASGRLTTYPGRSKYQLVISSFEPAGMGALLKQLEERKNRLKAEGLFDADKKKALPPFPKTIGIITSPTGAVIRDILHRLRDRFPCHVIVWPVLVQGPGAADQISAAIEGFNALSSYRPDLLIIARGGGSLEDLWAFNEENVVRSAANSEIPLISAVGHETDTTLIDFAADHRAPTPTAAAEIASPLLSDLLASVQNGHRRLMDATHTCLHVHGLTVQSLARGLTDPKHLIEDKMTRLDDWQERLMKSISFYQKIRKTDVLNLGQRLRSPSQSLQQLSEKIAASHTLLQGAVSWVFDQKTVQLTHLDTRLNQSSYDRQLERGFCRVLSAEGKTLSSVTQVKPHHLVTLHFKDGQIPAVALPHSAFTAPGNPEKRKKQKMAGNPAPQQPKLF